jgi:hypothetical protein
LKLEIVQFFSRLVQSAVLKSPTRCRAILSHLTDQLTSPEDDYAVAVLAFARDYSSNLGFKDFASDLFTDISKLKSDTIFAAEFDLFKENPALATRAFPETSDHDRLLVASELVLYLADKNAFTLELWGAVFGQLLNLWTTPALLQVPGAQEQAFRAIGPFFSSPVTIHFGFDFVFSNPSVELGKVSRRRLIERFSGITNDALLTAIGRAAGEKWWRVKTNLKVEDFCRLFCHAFRAAPYCFADLRSVVAIFTSMRNFHYCYSLVELVDQAVSKEFSEDLLAVAQSNLPRNPVFAVLCAAMPNLPVDAQKSLFQRVFECKEHFSFDLALEFLATFSVRYCDFTLSSLAALWLSNQLHRCKTTARRPHLIDAIRAVLTALPQSLIEHARSQHLPECEQHIWGIIVATIPRAGDFDAIRDAFPTFEKGFDLREPLKAGVEAKQYRNFLTIDFLPYLPMILANVPWSPKLAATLLNLWINGARKNPPLGDRVRKFGELLFRRGTEPKTLFESLLTLLQSPQQPSDSLTAARLIASQCNWGSSVKFPQDLLVSSLLLFIPQTFAEEENVRDSAFLAVAAIWRLEPVEPPSYGVLSRSEIDIAARKLYSYCAKHAPRDLLMALVTAVSNQSQPSRSMGLVLASLLSGAERLCDNKKVPAWGVLVKQYANQTPPVREHFCRGWIEAAGKWMTAFVRLALDMPSDAGRIIVDWILRSPQRPSFIEAFLEQFWRYMWQGRSAHDMLTHIIQTVPFAPFGPFGEILAENVVSAVLVWIAVLVGSVRAVYFTKRLDPSFFADVCNVISQQAVAAFDESLILGELSTSDITSAIATISRGVAQFSCEQIMSLLASSRDMIQSSRPVDWLAPSYAMIVGMLCASLASILANCSSPGMTDLKNELSELIAQALFVAHPTCGLELTSALSDVNWDLAESAAVRVYSGIVNVLSLKRAEEAAEHVLRSLRLLSRVIPRIPKTEIEVQPLCVALQNVLELCGFNASFLTPLEICAEIGPGLAPFYASAKLRIGHFFQLIATAGPEGEARIIRIIGKLIANLLLPAHAKLLTPSQLAQDGLHILEMATKPYSPPVLDMVRSIAVALASSKNAEAIEFQRTVLPILMDGVDPKYGESSQRSSTAILMLTK